MKNKKMLQGEKPSGVKRKRNGVSARQLIYASTHMQRFMDVVDRFRGKKICVVGDVIADVYIFGKPYRLSREAPVVVVKFEESRVCPGSAGNAINNLIALGAHIYPVGFIGSDNAGKKLMEYFSQYRNIDRGGLIRYDGETITKTRILAGDTHTSKQQVIRIDKEGS